MVTGRCGNPSCGRLFRLRNQHQANALEAGHSVYCSRPCAARGTNHRQARKGKIRVPCSRPDCGQTFEPSNRQLARIEAGLPVYCSTSCSTQMRHRLANGRPVSPQRSHLYRDVRVRCPWESGTMPTQWREVPIW